MVTNWLKKLTLIAIGAITAGALAIGATSAAWAQDEPADRQDQESQDEPAQEEETEDAEPLTAEDLVGKAREAFQDERFDEAVDFMRQAHEAAPDDLNVCMMAAQVFTRIAHQKAEEDREQANELFIESANLVRQALKSDELPEEAKPMLASFIYNEACAYALQGESDRALASLGEAFEMGFEDVDLVSEDADLASIRDNPRFKDLVTKAVAAIATRVAEETKLELEEFESFDFDFELNDLDGNAVALGDFEDKVVIVDVWGTWCPPCRAEIPSFVKLKDEFGKQGLEIVGINYEREEDEEKAIELIREFIDENKMNYTCVIGTEEVQEQIPDFSGYPTTLFIDREGKVRMMLVGAHSHTKLKSVVEALLSSGSE